jgi:hypothetical protein
LHISSSNTRRCEDRRGHSPVARLPNPHQNEDSPLPCRTSRSSYPPIPASKASRIQICRVFLANPIFGGRDHSIPVDWQRQRRATVSGSRHGENQSAGVCSGICRWRAESDIGCPRSLPT